MVNKVGLGQVVIRALRFLSVIIIPALLYTHLHLHVAFPSRTNGRSRGNFQNSRCRLLLPGNSDKAYISQTQPSTLLTHIYNRITLYARKYF